MVGGKIASYCKVGGRTCSISELSFLLGLLCETNHVINDN